MIDLYSSPDIFRVIKSRRMRWTGHVKCMEDRKGVYRDLVGKSGRSRCRWEDKLRWIFRKWNVGVWPRSNWLRIATGGGHL